MTDYDKIKHMCELQKALDERILQGREYNFNAVSMALKCEVGELLAVQEHLFKYWKKNPVNDRQKALIEFTDCVHFVLSFNIKRYGIDWVASFVNARIKEVKNGDMVYDARNFNAYLELLMEKMLIRELILIMFALGFTLDDVYTAYLEKNAVNHKRQEEGY